MKSGDTSKNYPTSRKNGVFIWLMSLFSITAVTLSDFILPWGGVNIAYELAMILGMIILAYIQYKFPANAWKLAVAGACLSIVSAFLFRSASFVGALIFFRLGLAALFVYALGCVEAMVNLSHSYLPFTSCALVSYGLIATLRCFQITKLHFAATGAACSILAALFVVLSRNSAPREEDEQPGPGRREVDEPLSGIVVALLMTLLVASQLFNSMDMYIFSQFSQTYLEGSGAAFSTCVAPIGISYILGGGVARKKGIPVLFVASCSLSQFFLLLMMICVDTKWGFLLLPLYVLSSAGIDLCIILFPTVFRAKLPIPLSPLVAGVILFRLFKLYLIPSLLPARWGWGASNHPVLMLAILAAMCQMLAVIYMVIMKKNLKIAQLKDMIMSAEVSRSTPTPIPSSITAREREVMALLLAGKNRNEIADCMGISFSTVNKHCVSIYRKTECSSHLELLGKYGYSPTDKSGSDKLYGTA